MDHPGESIDSRYGNDGNNPLEQHKGIDKLAMSSFRRRPEELHNSAAGHRFGFRNVNMDDRLRRSEAIPAFAGMTK